MNYKIRKILEELKVLVILVIIAFTIKSTLVEIYVVPTGSMEDTILTGDMLVGNKFIYGMRTPIWIGIPYTRLGFNIPWLRLPAFKEVKRMDYLPNSFYGFFRTDNSFHGVEPIEEAVERNSLLYYVRVKETDS